MKHRAPTDITFCRLRPAHGVTEAAAATRRAEGTTSLEMPCPDERSVAACLSGGLLPVSVGVAEAEVISWVVPPDEASNCRTVGLPVGESRWSIRTTGPR